MKLYTEEDLRDFIDRNGCIVESDLDEKQLTPIELPSDKEIDAHVEDDFLNASEVHKYSGEAQLLMKAMCKAGALWLRDKIQGGNK